MNFVEQQICGVCGPKNKTVSWVIFPAMANIKASIPVSINKSKINRLGANGERYYIDKKRVMHTGFYTLIDARNKMISPALITVVMLQRHEKFHVKTMEKHGKK